MISLHHTVALALFLVLSPELALAQSQYPKSVFVKAAKVFNTLEQPVTFIYRFETDNWQRQRIEPRSSVYIFDFHPRHELQVKLDSQASPQPYQLDTSFVTLNKKHAQHSPEPNIARNDEANPFHVARDGAGSPAVFRGLPANWVTSAAESLRTRLARSGVDLSIVSAPIDSSTTDVFLENLEFQSMASIIGEEYGRVMNTSELPTMRIEWVKPEGVVTALHYPKVNVTGCSRAQSEKFLRDITSLAIGETPSWFKVGYTQSYRLSEFIALANLNPRYIVSNRPNIAAVNQDIMNSLNSPGELGAAHSHKVSHLSRRICSNWRIRQRKSSYYRWKMIIDVKAVPTKLSPGVELTTNVIAQKRIGLSDNWRELAQFAVYDLGDHLFETQSNNNSVETEQASSSIGLKSSAAIATCMDMSRRLAKLVTR